MAGGYGYKFLSTNGLVKSGPGIVHAVTVTGTADCYVKLMDEVGDSGDTIVTLRCLADSSVTAVLDVAFGVGLYAVLYGAGVNATVSYL